MAIGRRGSDGKTKGAGEKFNTMTFFKKGNWRHFPFFASLIPAARREKSSLICLIERPPPCVSVDGVGRLGAEEKGRRR